VNITAVNLNLLVVFEALYEERSVSRAAARVGLSQPALSNALARLRDTFDDSLFTRTRRGMAPTPRAVELAAPVRAGLAQLRAAVAGPPAFDPASSARTFRVACTDYAEMLFAGPLLARVHRAAPEVQIVIRRLDRIFAAPEADLRAGAVDAAIGFFQDASALEPSTRVRELFAEENVCIARRGHPLLRSRLTAQRFAEAPQAGIFYQAETRGMVDNVLAAEGLRRRLQATTPHFLAAPHLVASSDVLACVPAGLAARFRRWLPIEVRKLPVALPPFHMRLAWHATTDDDTAQQWFRAQIVAACPHAA
jgi:DNA-binding transcriptional LysR family regulator